MEANKKCSWNKSSWSSKAWKTNIFIPCLNAIKGWRNSLKHFV